MVTEYRLPVTRACWAAGLSRAAYDKTPPLPQDKDAEVIDALNGVVERNGRWGLLEMLRPAAPGWPPLEPQTGLAGVLRAGPEHSPPNEAAHPQVRADSAGGGRWISCTTCSTTADGSAL
jgi:hypothetical protein